MGRSMVIIWYGITSFLLGVVLFFPVRKFILALNINRQQKKMQRQLTDEEVLVLKRKVTVIAGFLAVTFAFVYNKLIMLKMFGSLNG